MDLRKILRRAAARYGLVAPYVGTAGILYGIHHSFRTLDTLGHSRTIVFHGVAVGLSATVTLMLSVGVTVVLYEFVQGSSNDDHTT